MSGRFNLIKQAILEAEDSGPVNFFEDLQGYSGKKLIGCLQRLSEVLLDENTCYLEIGVYRGLTLVSVSSVVKEGVKVFGIDNFAFFDKDGQNEKIINGYVDKYNLSGKVALINSDYEDALENLEKYIGSKKIGLYFVDGPHDYRSQLLCLELARKYLADEAVIVIDDCNYMHVRQANRDFLVSHPEFKLMYENYTFSHPDNMKDTSEARQGWWDGVNILIHDPENKLPVKYPETERNRALFENEHTIHAARYGALAPYTHWMFMALSSLRIKEFAKACIMYRRMKKRLYKSKVQPHGKYLHLNTYSEKLERWVNPG